MIHKSNAFLNPAQLSKSGAQKDASVCQILMAGWPQPADSYYPGSGLTVSSLQLSRSPRPPACSFKATWQNQWLWCGRGGLHRSREGLGPLSDLGMRRDSSYL